MVLKYRQNLEWRTPVFPSGDASMASASVVLPYPPNSLAILGLKGRALVRLRPWVPPPKKPISYYSSSCSTSLISPIISSGFETRPQRQVLIRSSSSDSATTAFSFPNVGQILHLAVSLGVIVAADKFLKQAFTAAAIKFPSALFGMFCVFSVLIVLDSFAPTAAMYVMNFFEPATLFIQRWLPLFYVPSLVVLPIAAAFYFLLFHFLSLVDPVLCPSPVTGWAASLCVAGYTAITIRKIVKTEMIPAEPMTKPAPFSTLEILVWSAVFIASFVLALINPTALGTSARTFLPFLLAATVLGYMVGSRFPAFVKKIFHPIVCCAFSADLAAIAYGYFSRSGLDAVLDNLVGSTRLVKRHAAEIFSSVIVATIFSLYSTAAIGRLIGLEPILTVSILPRCITVALALSIVSFFEGANTSLTAAVVVLTGLVGANFVQAVMDKLGFNDPIARGIATASSAHGLGTAALSAKEPEALPFCAIAYALTGIFGSLLCSIPAVSSLTCRAIKVSSILHGIGAAPIKEVPALFLGLPEGYNSSASEEGESWTS
ncbi:Plastidal glycolate/glycerate translocator 1, chloroplastic [Dendrobium catenatum]|uniref:Plastidal glycolate/glycerate translocator 1, chloroplastic n=1 Tax=Dendrobium catenatum TaxID=906689 RepID=A0A2I0W2G0_9ASPA|nr:Plastidal glycolate/glycerate translocator 1, chloroplastic [Dendrobium catenatum]